MKIRNTEKILKTVSLFSGCGGLDLGFEGNFEVLSKSLNKHTHPTICPIESRKGWNILPETRFKTIFANDIFPAAKSAWIPHFQNRGAKKEYFHLESIVNLVKTAKKSKNIIFPHADVVTGGFPCQDFSVAGKRNGFNSHKNHNGLLAQNHNNPTEENRGKLYLWMRSVIDIVRPKVFIAENVKGLVSLTNAKNIIENDFKSIGKDGYIVINARILFAANYGIPQSRERVIFLGFRKDALTKEAKKAFISNNIPEELDPYPVVSHAPERNGLFPYVSVKDCLVGLKEPDKTKDLSQKYYSKAKWYGRHCQGQKEVDLKSISPTIRAEHHGNIEFRRLSSEHGGKNNNELKKGLIERRLTVRECARIQTFPDDFTFVKNPNEISSEYKLCPSEGYKIIGNAVPPLLGFHIAWRLQELWPIIFKHKE